MTQYGEWSVGLEEIIKCKPNKLKPLLIEHADVMVTVCSAAKNQQKEKELQIVFCNSLICLVSRAGIEPATY